MKAFVIEGPERASVKEIDEPKITPDEVLVEVKASGICGTDIHIYKGEFPVQFPVIPGHEFSGVVVKVGSKVKDLVEGDRVAVNPNLFCGKCYYCKKGLVHFCKNWQAIGIHRQGAYAPLVAVPEGNVHKIPNSLSFEEAAFSEPVACCLRGQDRLRIKHGDTVVVYGLGPIGLIHVQLAKLRGVSLVIGVEIQEKRLKIGEKFADLVLNPLEVDVIKEVKELTEGRGVDAVIEATGNPKVFKQAFEILDYGGRLLVFGVAPEKALVEISPYLIYRKEIEVIGSFTNPFTTERAVKDLSSGRLHVKPLVSHKISLEDVLEYYGKIMSKESDIVKVLITF